MASRETSREVGKEKTEILLKYTAQIKAQSKTTMERALVALPIKEQRLEKVKDGLLLYINTIINKYLLIYQNTPEEFFKHMPQIKKELKEYIDFMLYGIMEEGEK